MKDALSLTLEELLSQSYYIHITKNPKFGFDIWLEDEDGVPYESKGVHPFAIQSLKELIRSFEANLKVLKIE